MHCLSLVFLVFLVLLGLLGRDILLHNKFPGVQFLRLKHHAECGFKQNLHQIGPQLECSKWGVAQSSRPSVTGSKGELLISARVH